MTTHTKGKSITLIAGIVGILAVFSANASEHTDTEQYMINTAGKAIYMNEFCGTNIEKDKFFEVAKLAAFANGQSMPEPADLNWNELQQPAHRAYYDYAVANPNGSACEQLLERTANVLPMLESGGVMQLDLEQQLAQ
ncbi:hypothetical protein GCM10011369_15160 [Neiella marina]|uniref:HdeA/HdeB family protein n=1 Tax=Neiella marina TaxID=508461 RepID=A0A8J2XNS4_9GAMM|nr:hypothetical protein [Neiella marina]GGA74290.1 hypothetical protein GCM10011369_15160 [Neiella marina]